MQQDLQNSEDNKENIPKSGPWSSLDKNQKIALIVLALFAFFIILLWAVQLKKSINDPFIYKGDSNIASSTPDNSDEALKNKDTDSDGLSDWDELNIYRTSPYLEDTDGDNIQDGAEVKNGTDPNCQEGKVCGGSGTDNNPASTTPPAPQVQASSSSSISGQLNVDPNKQSGDDLSGLLGGQLDAASLRKVLIDSGLDKAMLDQISDEQLLKNYQDTFKQ